MNEKDELQEFDLEDILNEFHEEPQQEEAADEQSAPDTQAEEAEAVAADAQEPAAEEAVPQEPLEDTQEFTAVEEPAPADPSADTIRLDDLSGVAESQPQEEERQPEPEQEPAPRPNIIELDPKARLRELKRKLIAGPEKRYYELAELGLGKLQTSVFVNIIIVLLCAGVTAMFALGMVPDNRLRLVIFSQVLAMLLSAWMGCGQMLDGLGDLFRLRFTANTLLAVTFLACCADAVLCLEELRLPCCAAFSLEMAMAQLSAYHRRSTHMAQMDTLRKAVRLHSLVKAPDYFEKKAGFLRGYGDVDHFMNNYDKTTAPEKFQNIYCFVSLLLCGGIAAYGGMLHGTSMALRLLSTSLLVAVPAGYFVALSRPAAILEKRLHMVGAVLCGWQGVKNMKGKAAFPLRDEDLFPVGATKLNGVKFYSDRTPDDTINFATSLILEAGGGLAGVFQQLMNSRGGHILRVKNVQNYGSGIGGEVAGESVLLGSLALLQDKGVEIPEGTMVNQAVYVAIDGELCAVVAISYGKMRSAAGGIVSLTSSRRITPVMVGGDFMLTESLVRTKFGVNTRRMAFPNREVRGQLAERQADPNATAMALCTRDDLISYAYAITGARALRTACALGTVLHVFGGLLGMLIMLALAYLGSADLVTPVNVLLYQLVWLIPGLLITEWARTV